MMLNFRICTHIIENCGIPYVDTSDRPITVYRWQVYVRYKIYIQLKLKLQLPRFMR